MRAKAVVLDHEFKLGMRQVVSSVAVVTSRAGIVRNGLTATAVCIAESGHFAINFLTEAQHNIARLFSKSKLDPDARFGEGNWLSMVTGSPILDGAVASFDCEVEERIPAASHHIYIGRVVAVVSNSLDALLYRDGLFRRLTAAD